MVLDEIVVLDLGFRDVRMRYRDTGDKERTYAQNAAEPAAANFLYLTPRLGGRNSNQWGQVRVSRLVRKSGRSYQCQLGGFPSIRHIRNACRL